MIDKLKNLPKIHYISLEENIERRTNLENWFKKYNIFVFNHNILYYNVFYKLFYTIKYFKYNHSNHFFSKRRNFCTFTKMNIE